MKEFFVLCEEKDTDKVVLELKRLGYSEWRHPSAMKWYEYCNGILANEDAEYLFTYFCGDEEIDFINYEELKEL